MALNMLLYGDNMFRCG